MGALWGLGQFAQTAGLAPPGRTMSLIFLRAPAPEPAQRPQAHASLRIGTTTVQQQQQEQVADAQTEQPVPVPPSEGMNWQEPAKNRDNIAGLRDRVLSQARQMAHEMAPRGEIAPALSRQERLAHGIAAAFKTRTTTFEELRAADGSPITKVSGPAGTYCIMRDTNLGAGHDTIRDGARDKSVRCPR